jgi:hypothetical protein
MPTPATTQIFVAVDTTDLATAAVQTAATAGVIPGIKLGLEFFTALQRQGVPSRLVLFPDEGHWISKPQNSVVWYREFLGWLDRYLARDNGSDRSRQ